MRQRGQKFVLEISRLFGGLSARLADSNNRAVFNRNRGLSRQADDHSLCAFCEDTALGVAEEQTAGHLSGSTDDGIVEEEARKRLAQVLQHAHQREVFGDPVFRDPGEPRPVESSLDYKF